MLSTADRFEVENLWHLKLIAENLSTVTRLVFFRHPWIVVRYSRKSLATSDTPVVLVPRRSDFERRVGTGIGTAAELYVPISRRVGLCMGDLPDPELGQEPETYERQGTSNTSRWMNIETVRNARRVVFHHPGDKPLERMDIQGERAAEVDTSYIDDLIRAFAA